LALIECIEPLNSVVAGESSPSYELLPLYIFILLIINFHKIK